MNYIKSFDFFGSPLQIQITSHQSVYKSFIGGLFTILVLAASFFYSIWMTYKWQTNQLNPKITEVQFASDFRLLNLGGQLIKISSWKYNDDVVDPIKEKVLLVIAKYSDKEYNSYKQIILQETELISDYNAVVVSPPMEMDFQNLKGQQKSITEMEVILVLCEDELLPEGQQCASEETKEKYFNQSSNYIAISFDLTTINPSTQQPETNQQAFFLSVEEQFCQGINIYLQSHRFEIKNEVFFTNPVLKEFISAVDGTPQTNTRRFCEKAYGLKSVFGRMYITWAGNQKYIVLDYPNASDILANIGSIVSVLFLIKHLVYFINHHFLNEEMIHEIISFYYPQFKQIKIKKNWKFQITKVSLNNEELLVSEFVRFYDKVSKQIQSKLSFENLWYELSRLYFVVRSIRSQEDFRKSHRLGIRIPILDILQRESLGIQCETIYSKDQINSPNRISALSIDDINLISVGERQKYLNENVDEEMQAEDFFSKNNICR